jgi:uncharacterized protein (DUF1786 family)|tara:strand:- start:1188 stop:2225 length:1038 start_codon:yes stop_codon:yes gene_type:complete
MRILAIDVGMGTQDILIYNDSGVVENSVKMVFPSMTQILAKKIVSSKNNLCFHGSTMGGGPLSYAIKKHMRKGFKVEMTESSARSLRDDIEQVKKMGIEIITEDEIGRRQGELIETKDVDFHLIKDILERVGEEFKFDIIGVAVQDHGYAKEKSDREFRFEKFKESIEKDGKISSLGFTNPPPYYTRMKSISKVIKKHCQKLFIVDSKISAIVGAMHGIEDYPLITIDIGNGHTMAALMKDKIEVLGLFEHHSHLLNTRTLESYISKFAEGELKNKEVLRDGGHGCYIRQGISLNNLKNILITGPKREILQNSNLGVSKATPIGDVMMTGPIGIVDLIKYSNTNV